MPLSRGHPYGTVTTTAMTRGREEMARWMAPEETKRDEMNGLRRGNSMRQETTTTTRTTLLFCIRLLRKANRHRHRLHSNQKSDGDSFDYQGGFLNGW